MVFNNAQLASFFNKMNKNLSTCNAECQRKKKLDKLKTEYINAQNRLSNAKPEFDNAEKHWLSEKYGDVYYNNVLENRAKTEATNNVNNWNSLVNKIFDDLETKINYISSQNTYRDNIQRVKHSYSKDLNRLKRKVNDTKSKKQVNQRLGYYYNESTNVLNDIIYYLKIFYWILVVISIGLIVLKKKYKQPVYWPYFIMIVGFPWFLYYGYLNIMKVFRHLYIDNIYFISVLLILTVLFVFNKVASIPFVAAPVPE